MELLAEDRQPPQMTAPSRTSYRRSAALSVLVGVLGGALFYADAVWVSGGPLFWGGLAAIIVGVGWGLWAGIRAALRGEPGLGVTGAVLCGFVLLVIVHPFFMHR